MADADQSNDFFVKHIDLIQSIVARMSTNSFLVRGWSVTILSGIFALASKNDAHALLPIAFVPLLAFWLLDGFYLSQERRFRQLYAAVLANDNRVSSLSLDASLVCEDRLMWPKALFSRTIATLHGVLAVSLLLVMIYFRNH
jgi:hypothetical protein